VTQKTSALNNKNTSWSGRFNEPVAELVRKYTASVGFDYRLAEFDIQGSLAHAQMLGAQKIISLEDVKVIEAGLAEILLEIQAGQFEWLLDLEDVHLNIEKRLTDKIGDAGKRLHTGRSRNDQVATDVRLWLRATTDQVIAALKKLQLSVLDLADAHFDTVMPGFTHLQVAQPVTFGHHLMAYVEMLSRDGQRFTDCRRRINRLPLGAAALAGTSYPIDRELVAKKLGFDGGM
jgi:argininosuccinate lyase